ncbi:phage portal protein [Kordiimonas aquimaris]|uniref:phage portal protein n=1 Tax=Kordiimonas aquimaris TaxID=707591 RepID=UPI0021CEF465|nr:phage portal protein [Kordiimonas aquimaris]
MALFDRLFGPKPDKNLNAEQGKKRFEAKQANRPIWARVGPGNAVSTPRRYDRLADEGYRQNVVAYRAVNLVAKAVASIPFTLMRGDERLSDHPLLALLARPNPKLKGENFLYNFVGYYLIAGNAYAVKVGPDGGMPKELWLLRPDTMQVVEGTDGLPAGFEQQLAGKKQRFDADSVLHLKTFNPLSDWYGLAPLEAAAMAVDAHNESSRWNLALVQNGGTPSGVLYQDEADAPLTDAQFDKLKSEIENQYTGAVNAGRPLLLEGGLKWQDMGLSPKDMDWASAKNMSAREIALAFGVPPQMMGVPDAQTYANYAEARQSLWEDTIIPLAQDIAQELTNWLVPDFNGGTRALQTSARRDDKQQLKLTLDLDDVPALSAKRAAKFDRIANAAFLSDEEKRTVLGFGK